MKKFILLIVLFAGFFTTAFSQCTVNSFIQDNYELDAKFMALREIVNNPADPDYDNPFLPQARVTPFLEKLSAIYENPNNEPVIDSLFNEFQIHANQEYHVQVVYKMMIFSVQTNVSWVQDFKDTGISGVPLLDNLMSTYQFSIESFIDLGSCSCTHFRIETAFDFLNVHALIDDFQGVSDLDIVEVYFPNFLDARFNYMGIPYTITDPNWGTFPVAVCDILVDNNTYTFFMGGGDCFNGCVVSKSWNIGVSEDCETVTLSTSEMELEKFAIHPNPASDIIYIHGVTSEINSTLIYSVGGQLISSSTSNSETIDISNLSAGLYFLEVITSEGNKQILKFIKN